MIRWYVIYYLENEYEGLTEDYSYINIGKKRIGSYPSITLGVF